MIYTRENIITKKYRDVSIDILPERGAIITSLNIRGVELLYQGMLDETLWDTASSIRGGIPFMFPQAGALNADEITALGYTMPQHGTARNNAWKLSSETDDSISFEWGSDSQTTNDSIPLEFKVIATYTLIKNGVRLSYNIINKSSEVFNVSPGIHPYFAVPLGNKNDIVFDNDHATQIRRERDIWQNDGTTFLTPDMHAINFDIPATGKIELAFDENTNNIRIWSLPGKDFVCIEPVTGNPGNIVKNPIKIPASSSHLIAYEITLGL